MTGQAADRAGDETARPGEDMPCPVVGDYVIGPVELMGTCDWGYCDREAVTVRWSKDHGWLSVCAPCKRSTWDRSARGRRR